MHHDTSYPKEQRTCRSPKEREQKYLATSSGEQINGLRPSPRKKRMERRRHSPELPCHAIFKVTRPRFWGGQRFRTSNIDGHGGRQYVRTVACMKARTKPSPFISRVPRIYIYIMVRAWRCNRKWMKTVEAQH